MLIDLKEWVSTLVPYIGFILIYFSKIVKQENLAYVNHARIRSWNQPVLSNTGTCSRKQHEPLMGFQTHIWQVRSQKLYPLCHATYTGVIGFEGFHCTSLLKLYFQFISTYHLVKYSPKEKLYEATPWRQYLIQRFGDTVYLMYSWRDP